MGADTDNAVMTKAEARVIELLNRAKIARGDESGDDIVEMLKALPAIMQAQNGNGTKATVAKISGILLVAGAICGFLGVEVISQGKAIAALQTEVQQCIKVKP